MKLKTSCYKSLRENFDLDGKLNHGLGFVGSTSNLTIQNNIATIDANSIQEYEGYSGAWDVSSSWLNRIPITLTQTSGATLTNYPVLLEFGPGHIIYNYVQTDGDDLRFFDTEGNELDYWLESWNHNESSYVWVQIPSLTSTFVIYMYMNNSGASEQGETFSEVHTKTHQSDSNCIACYHMDHHQQQAYDFNGAANSINLGAINWSARTVGSFGLWLKFDTKGDTQDIFTYFKDVQNYALFRYEFGPNRVKFILETGGVTRIDINSNADVTTGEWNYYMIVQTGSTSTMFINNVAQTDTDSGEWFDNVGSATIVSVGNITGGPNALDGQIGDFKLWYTALDSDERAQAMRGENVQASNMDLWLDMEYVSGTTMFDLSGNGNDGTVSGATSASTFLADCPTCGSGSYHGIFKGSGEPRTNGTDGNKFGGGKALWFDGVDDKVVVGSDTSLNLDGSDLTFSCWIYRESIGSIHMLFSKHDSNAAGKFLYLMIHSSNVVRFGTWADQVDTTQTISVERWYHIAATYTESTKGVIIYIDGNSAATGTLSQSFSDTNDDDLEIGADTFNGWYMHGKITEAKVWNTVLAQANIRSNIAGTSTDLSNLKLNLNFKQISGSTSYDQSGNDNSGTITGAIETLGDYPVIGNYCLEFDTDEVTTSYTPSASAFSVSCWVKPFTVNAAHHGVCTTLTTGDVDRDGFFLNLGNNDNWQFSGFSNDVAVFDCESILDAEANKWVHLCGVYDGVGGYLYLNGILQEYDPGVLSTIDGTLSLGKMYKALADRYFDGRIDDYRVWDLALSGLEVQQVMSGNTSIQTGNLDIYYTMQDISGSTLPDNSGNNNDGTISGAIEVVDDINIYDGNLAGIETINDCLDSDGSDDYVGCGAVDFSTHTVGSITCWVKFDTHADDQYLFDYYVDANNYMRLYCNNGDSRLTFILHDGGATVIDIDSDDDVCAKPGWHFVVITQNGTTSTMYIDGIAQSDTDSGEWFDEIGASTNMYLFNNNAKNVALDGQMDEFRIYDIALSADEINQLFKIGHRHLSPDSFDKIGRYLYNKIPIGTVPQIDSSTFFGETYITDFDFRINTLANSGDLVYLALVTNDRIIPNDPSLIQADLENNAKLAIYAQNDSGTINLYYKAWDDDNDDWWYDGTDWDTATETSTGDSLSLNTWYRCIIKRNYDSYYIYVKEMDGTEVENAEDLLFNDFTGSENLRFSSYDDTNGETADYVLTGAAIAPLNDIQVSVDNVRYSTPIEFVPSLINFEGSKETNNAISNLALSLSNTPDNNRLLKNITERYSNLIKEDDEIIIYEDIEEAELI